MGKEPGHEASDAKTVGVSVREDFNPKRNVPGSDERLFLPAQFDNLDPVQIARAEAVFPVSHVDVDGLDFQFF